MEDEIINIIDNTEILEQIQIDSYNLNQQFLKLNEQILVEDIATEKTIQNHIKDINSSITLLTSIIIVYIVLQIVKLRGDRNNG